MKRRVLQLLPALLAATLAGGCVTATVGSDAVGVAVSTISIERRSPRSSSTTR